MKSLRDHFASNLSVYILVVVLGGLLSFYSFVFIPMNERQVNQHLDRLLANKAKTVYEKYKGYKGAIESTPIAYVISRAFSLKPGLDPIYFYKLSDEQTMLYGFDPAALCLRAKDHKVDILTTNLTRIKREDMKRTAVDPALNVQSNEKNLSIEQEYLWQEPSGAFRFIYEPDGTFINTDSAKSAHPFFWLSVDDFMQNIKERDFFDDMFLVSIDTATRNKRHFRHSTVLDRSSLGLVEFDLPDSLLKTGTGFFFRKISDRTYGTYVKEIKLKRDLRVYLIGLIDKSKLTTKSREVPAWFVVFSSLIALLLIFLLPIIKLFSINKSERLLSRDARLTVFSLILTVSLLTILLGGCYLFWGPEKNQLDGSIKALSKKMDSSARAQISNVVSALSDEGIFEEKSWQHALSIHNVSHFNEVIRVNISDNDQYPFGTVLKAFGEKGTCYLTDTFPIDLGSREYVQMPKAAMDNDLSSDYFLQAFNSYSSGRAEVGVSKLQKKEKKVAVITSRLPAIINATVPTPFHYVVTDKEGEVKFNSRWDELQIENFVSECNDDVSLSHHIRNDVAGPLSFNYLGSDCSGYGKPILKDWFLIVYYEVSNTRNLAAEVFGLCLLTLAIVVIVTALVHLCLLADRKKSSVLKTSDFIYHWLNPFSVSSSMWMKLSIVCFVLFLSEMIWSWFFYSTVTDIFFIISCITLFYLISYRSLSPKSAASRGPSRATKGILFLLLLWVLCLVAIIVFSHAWWQLVFIVLCSIVIYLLARQNECFFDWASKKIKTYLAYRFFLVASLMVIAVGPSITFLSNHYYFASLSKGYHYAFEDIRKLQVKKVDFDKRLQGSNYIQWPARNHSRVNEEMDSAFYYFIQSLQPQTLSLSAINLGLLPNENPTKSFHNHNALFMQAPSSTLSSEDEVIVASAKIQKLEWVNNSFSHCVLLVALIVAGALWYVLYLLPRKIFFAPDLITWDCYPKTYSSNFLEREFQNDDEPRHPLHFFKKHKKEKLLQEKEIVGFQKYNEVDQQYIHDEYILKLQDKAEDLYQVTWYRCSDSEKYFLYDLASDGVANQVDQVLIRGLAGKGLIRLRPHLALVNTSFANYVLKAMTDDEIAKWKEKESTEGNWKNLKWILLILIATVFIFLSVAEENFLGRVTAIVASIGLVVPQLVNIISSVGGIFKKG